MTTPTHTDRFVCSFNMFDSSRSDEELRLLLVHEALQDGVRQAVVMPAQGTILFISQSGDHEQWTCSRDKASWPEEMAAALRNRGFFTEGAPPTTVPSVLVTPRDDEDQQYLVEKSIEPQSTHYHLME